MTLRVLDCDHVFDALTRGPFPSGQSDDSLVDDHLRTCHDCRRLAEALRPSVDMFHESLRGEDSLPGYYGELDQAEQDSIESVMRRVRDEEPRVAKPVTIRRIDPLSVAAAAIVGLVMGVLLASSGDQQRRPINLQTTSANRTSPVGMAMLTNLDLIQACQAEPVKAADQVSETEHAFSCCTRCHRYAPEKSEQQAHFSEMAKLLSGCRACHDA